MKLFTLFCLLFLVIGCGLEVDSIDNEKFKQAQVEDLKESFSIVKGFYEGELITEKGVFPIEMKVHIFEPLGEPGADGKPAPKVELIGRFRRADIVQSLDYMNFNCEFNPSTGILKMSYKSNNIDRGFGIAEDATVYGKYTNGQIKGYFSVSGGVVGQLIVKRTRRDVIGKSQLEEINEYHDRLYQAYKPLVGVYEDCVRPTNGREFPIQLNIYMGYEGEKPILRARVKKLDINIPFDIGVNITYDQYTHEVTIELIEKADSGRRGGYIYAAGHFKNETMTLTSFQYGRLPVGSFKSFKNKKLKMGYCNKKLD